MTVHYLTAAISLTLILLLLQSTQFDMQVPTTDLVSGSHFISLIYQRMQPCTYDGECADGVAYMGPASVGVLDWLTRALPVLLFERIGSVCFSVSDRCRPLPGSAYRSTTALHIGCVCL